MGGAEAGTRQAVRNEGVGNMHQQAHRPPQRMSAVRAHHGRGLDASVMERWSPVVRSPVVRSVMTVAAAVVVVAALWATALSR